MAVGRVTVTNAHISLHEDTSVTPAEWIASIAAIAGLVGQFIVFVYFYGGLSRAVKDHDDQFDEVSEEQKDQWNQIGTLREDVGRVKGVLGINGSILPHKH